MNCAMEWVCYFPFSYKYVLVWRDLLQNNGFKASRVCDAGSCSHILVNARDCPAQGGADRVNAQVCTHVVISSRPRTSKEGVSCKRGLENYAIIIFDRFSPYTELFLCSAPWVSPAVWSLTWRSNAIITALRRVKKPINDGNVTYRSEISVPRRRAVQWLPLPMEAYFNFCYQKSNLKGYSEQVRRD